MQAATQQQKQSGPRATFPNPKPPVSPIAVISNRYSRLVGFLVTYTKQRTGADSNRYKNAVLTARFF